MKGNNKVNNNDSEAFSSYISTAFLRAGAIAACVCIIILAVMIILLVKADITMIVVIAFAAIILCFTISAGTLVLANMSDDQKYIAESLEKMQNDNYTIALTRWGPDYADPMTYLGM